MKFEEVIFMRHRNCPEVVLTIEATQNIYLVADGKISEGDAVRNMRKSIAKNVIAPRFSKNGVRRKVNSEVLRAARASDNRVIQSAARNYGGVIGSAASIAVISVVESLATDDEIDADKIFSRMVDNAAKDLASTAQSLAIFLPVPAISMGLLAIAACSRLYELYSAADAELESKFLQISQVAASALQEMNLQRELLKSLIDQKCRSWDETTNAAFQMILSSSMKNDFDAIDDGLNALMSLLGKEIRFRRGTDFDRIFADENFVFSF